MTEFHFTVRIELTILATSEAPGDGDCSRLARAGGLAAGRTEPAATACLRDPYTGWPGRQGRPASLRHETGRRQRAGLRTASRVGTFML